MNVALAGKLLWQRRQLRQRDDWTRQQLEVYQARSLRFLREYAYTRSPFYQRFHKGLTERPLQELPVLTKPVLMEHFDELVTDRAIHLNAVEAHVATLCGNERFLDRYWVTATSGSTGFRGLFLFNFSEWSMILASLARACDWAGIKVGLLQRTKLGGISSTTPWSPLRRYDASLHSWWVPTLRLDASEPVDRTVERLNAWQPGVLEGYASMIHVLAEEQLAGRLHISPQAILSGSEVLTDEVRRCSEQAWGKQPFNQYGATESGLLASECDLHQGMHLYEDLIIVEVVDKDNRPVPVGAYGDKVLITVLFSRTQPLIRYELSDMVRLAPSPCSCGRPYILIDDIQGRIEETLYFPNSAGDQIPVHHNVFDRVLEPVATRGWQVIQEPDGLHVLIRGMQEEFARKEVGKTLVDSLQRDLAAQGVIVPPVKVKWVSAIPRSAAGKAPLIKSNLNNTG